jgi:RNA polymerase sigma-70 factor, ECF subfamily
VRRHERLIARTIRAIVFAWEITGELKDVANNKLCSLVEAVAAHGDRKAFDELHRRLAGRVRASFLRSGVELSIAEDLTQDVMLKFWQSAHRYDRTKASVDTWLFCIAHNTRADHFRRRRGNPPIGDDALSVSDTTEPADEALNRAQWQERVRAALLKLPPKLLEILKMHFFEGLSHREISVRTGLPLGTVKGRIRSALRRLRRIVEASVPSARNGSCV